MFLIWLIYILEKSYVFEILNEENFYTKSIDLDEIYKFLVLSFSI